MVTLRTGCNGDRRVSRQPCCEQLLYGSTVCSGLHTVGCSRQAHATPCCPCCTCSPAQHISATLKEKFGCVPVFFESSELKDKYYKGGWWVVQEGCRAH